jgi:hypothetical protein
MKCLRKCLLKPAKNCVRMILLANNAEKDIAMLEKNYGGFDKIIEQLMSSIVIRELLKTLPEYLRLK